MLGPASHTCSPLAKMTKSLGRILAFVRDHSGRCSTSGLARILGISRSSVRRAHRLLRDLGIASVVEWMTSKGRQAAWSYDLSKVPEDVWSHAFITTAPPSPTGEMNAWLEPVGGRCQKGGLPAAPEPGPRFIRGKAEWAAARERWKARAKAAAASSRELLGVVATPEAVAKDVAQSEVENTQPGPTRRPALPPPDDARNLGGAKRLTASYGSVDVSDFGLLPDEQRIVDAYLTKLAQRPRIRGREQHIGGRYLAQFKHLVRCWLMEHDAHLVAMALQSILDTPNLAAYHTNTIETYGWNYVRDRVRNPDSEALGLWKQAA